MACQNCMVGFAADLVQRCLYSCFQVRLTGRLYFELQDISGVIRIFWFQKHIVAPKPALAVGGDDITILKIYNESKDKTVIKALWFTFRRRMFPAVEEAESIESRLLPRSAVINSL